MCQLSTSEKLDIVHEVLIKHTSYSDITALYKVKPRVISSLVKKTKNKEDFFQELKLIDFKKEIATKYVEDNANDILE